MLKLLSCSLILLAALSCRKKEKGVLDDFDSGRFDFVCIWNKNGVQDTVTGEVSGPDGSSASSYYFMVKQELNTTTYLKDFQVGNYSKMVSGPFTALGLLISAKITYEEHDSNHLKVDFQNDNPTFGPLVSGTFKLTRIE